MKFLISLICICISLVDAKFVAKVLFKQDLSSQVIFLTKFDYGSDGGAVNIKAIKKYPQTINQPKIQIDIITDDNHNQYLKFKNCQQRSNYIYKSSDMKFPLGSQKNELKLIIPNSIHQTIYYFYLSICEQSTRVQLKQIIVKNQYLKFEITLLNNQSHFGQDQKFLSGYLILVALWVLLLVKYAIPIGKSIFSDSNDKTKVIVFTGLILLGTSYFYRLIHLLIYFSNGKGIYFFQILYSILKTICEFIIVTTLVAISWGWSIIHLKHDQSYIIAGVIVALINIVGLIVNISADQLSNIHHKYDSTSGYILQILRIFIFLLFFIGIFRTLSLSVGAIRKFIKKLAVIGGIYLISWPLTVIFAEVFLPNYMHNQVIIFVQQITHIIATALLCQMLSYPDSSYRKVSLKQQDNPLKMQNYKFK